MHDAVRKSANVNDRPVRPASAVTVIGGGIIGVCCALELQSAGFQVTLIDKKGIAEECSAGNAGHFATEHIFPLSTPATLRQVPAMMLEKNGPLSLRWSYLPKLMPWLLRFLWAGRAAQVRRAVPAISALNERALGAYQSLDQRFGLNGLLKREGTLVVYQDPKAFAAANTERLLLADFGITTHSFDQKTLRAFDPNLLPSLAGGIFFPSSAHTVDPKRLVKILAEHFVARGGRVEIANIQDITVGQRGVRLKADCGTTSANKLVIAGGAWSHLLANRLGYKIPLETERGYHLMLNDPSLMPRVPTTYADRKFVATPMKDGLRIAGRVELGGLHLPMNEEQALALRPLADELLPGLEASDASSWMGFRPTLPDSLPVIGRAPNHGNIYFAFGHNHLGLTQGAVTGQLIKQLVSGEATDIDLTPYRINRF